MLRRSVMSDSPRPLGLQPARLLCPRDPPGKNTGVGAISFSRRPSRPRATTVSLVPRALAGGFCRHYGACEAPRSRSVHPKRHVGPQAHSPRNSPSGQRGGLLAAWPADSGRGWIRCLPAAWPAETEGGGGGCRRTGP